MGMKSLGARAFDAVLAVAGAALNAMLIAAAAAALVWLLPGKLAVFVLGLYGFIVVGLLQAVAAFALAFMLARMVFGHDLRGDAFRAVILCGGFLIAVALLNAYLLQLTALFGRDLTVTAAGVPLIGFLGFDQRVMGVFPLLPLAAPLAAAAGGWIDHALPAGAMAHTGTLGLFAGMVLAVWVEFAKGVKS
jgi:hypothetical protein